MKRQILFRGWSIIQTKWVEGDLVYDAIGLPRIAKPDSSGQGLTFIPVHPDSVGQFTGLLDMDGNKVFEGDIVEFFGKTCNFLPCGIYPDQKYSIGDKMIVQSLKSGFTLAGLNMGDCDIPNRVGKVDNYTFWNHAQSLKITGNTFKAE
jgi:hypothetical protein